MPVLAAASGMAAAALAALPLTLGFFKDERSSARHWGRGTLIGVIAVIAARRLSVRLRRTVSRSGFFAGAAAGRAARGAAYCSSRRAFPLATVGTHRTGASSGPFAELADETRPRSRTAPRSTSRPRTTSTPTGSVMAVAASSTRRSDPDRRAWPRGQITDAVGARRATRSGRAAAYGVCATSARRGLGPASRRQGPRACATAWRRCSSRPASLVALGFALALDRAARWRVGSVEIEVPSHPRPTRVLHRDDVHGRAGEPGTLVGPRTLGPRVPRWPDGYAVGGCAERRPRRHGPGRDDLHARLRRGLLAVCRHRRRTRRRPPAAPPGAGRRRQWPGIVAGITSFAVISAALSQHHSVQTRRQRSNGSGPATRRGGDLVTAILADFRGPRRDGQDQRAHGGRHRRRAPAPSTERAGRTAPSAPSRRGCSDPT